MIRQLIGAVAVAGSVAGHAGAAERVDLELVLLADASGSIDDAEIHFQRQGYAAAITHPEILGAIAQGYDQRIAVTYVEWGGVSSQEVVVPWTIIDGPDSAAAFAEALLEAPRRAFGRNAIGNAIAVGQGLIETNDIAGTRKVIDVSADSANNWGGISIAEARQTALAADIVINGLAILCRQCSGRPNAYDLEAAFAEADHRRPGQLRDQGRRRRALRRGGAQEADPRDRRHPPRARAGHPPGRERRWRGGSRLCRNPLAQQRRRAEEPRRQPAKACFPPGTMAGRGRCRRSPDRGRENRRPRPIEQASDSVPAASPDNSLWGAMP